MRVKRPWYKPHVERSALLDVVKWSAGLCLSWILFWQLPYSFRVFAAIAALICLAFLCDGMKSLWRNRHPFVFTVRGDRDVEFFEKGRDEIVFEENGRQAVIYSELGSKPNRGIYVSSITKWEPPHENEPLTDDQRENILALLCEHYDSLGISYELVEPSVA